MDSWFFHPSTAVSGFLARALFSARFEGLENVPRSGPFILAGNHCSNLDPAIIAWATGHQIDRVIHFMAKAEMRSWPFAGWLASKTGRDLRAPRRGGPGGAASRARGAVRGTPDRSLSRGHAIARRAPQGRPRRRRVSRHAHRCSGASGRNQRDASDLSGEVALAAPDQGGGADRGAVHASASAEPGSSRARSWRRAPNGSWRRSTRCCRRISDASPDRGRIYVYTRLLA